MGSLFAGPRTGICAYTEDDLRVGVTFYIAFLCEDRHVKKRGIVEIIEIINDVLVLQNVKDSSEKWWCPIEAFLITANLYTDMVGNSFYGSSIKKKKWQFWRKEKRGYPPCPKAPPLPEWVKEEWAEQPKTKRTIKHMGIDLGKGDSQGATVHWDKEGLITKVEYE